MNTYGTKSATSESGESPVTVAAISAASFTASSLVLEKKMVRKTLGSYVLLET